MNFYPMANRNPKLQEALKKILKVLTKRSQDIVKRRFGIGKKKKETLESIGHTYGITRERVRQIEKEAFKKLKSQENAQLLTPLFEELEFFISEQGGLMREERLIKEFIEYTDSETNPEKFKGFTLLLLALGKNFKHAKENAKFYSLWYTNKKALNQARVFIDELVNIFKKNRQLRQEKEIIALLKKSFPFFSRQAIRSYIDASKLISHNVFGDIGLSHWPEISPRGVKDKAYLVVKKKGIPLHFRAITKEINKANFSNHLAKPQTVHNELIKDKRFVLVGRGLYALTEWGYQEGTVKEVLRRIFQENKGKILSEEKIINLVRKQRFVKDNTIRFNLKSNVEFIEKKPNHYTLKS